MVLVWRKLSVMLWKCLVLRKRNWRISMLELLSPLFVAFAAYRLNILGKEIAEKNRPDPGSSYVLFPLEPISTIPVVTEHVAYTPTNQETADIMADFTASVQEQQMRRITNITSCQIDQLPDIPSLNDWLREKTVNNVLSIGIIFSEINKTSNVFRYTLSSNFYGMVSDKLIDPDFTAITMYDNVTSFLGVQVLVDKALLKYSGVEYNGDDIILGKLPVFIDDYSMAIFFLYLFIMCAYAILVASITKDVLQEKYTGITELMKIMGVSSWMIWTHWFFYAILVYLPVTIGMTIFLAGIDPRVLRVDVFILWLLLFLFSVDCIIILFAVSCLFDNPVKGSIICVAFWFVVHFSTLYYVTKPDELNFVFQVVMCLIPLHNLCWTVHSLSSFSKNDVTWTLAYTFSQGYTGSQISLGVSIIIFVSQTIVAVIALSILNMMYPGPYGVGKPITLICKSCLKSSNINMYKLSSEHIRGSNPSRFEHPPTGTKVGIKIRGLHKRYGLFNRVVSVENVDLDINEGEIMALLGHNGAGKTSTMAMITGMLTPTKGLITVNDKSIHSDLSSFRKSLGLCTQHNMYFHKLTVIEHLTFFGMIKGMSYSVAKKKGTHLLSLLNMAEKAKSKADTLSGGMQRRLCLAMSLVGKPKVLVLDEPTSGLDPENRHHIWDVVLSFRGSRTILITTHFMEEADALGDRIAIMAGGRIICCGSTMFLKKIYGAGYNIRILKSAKSAEKDIVKLFEQNLPSLDAKLVSPNQLEFTVKEDYVSIFPSLFQKLESEKKRLGIIGISVACTTLEDVFLKVAEKELVEDSASEEEQTDISLVQQRTMTRCYDYRRTKGFLWTLTCFQVLVWKRLLYRKRNYCSLLIKLLFCSLILCLMAYEPSEEYFKDSQQPSLNISLSMYPKSVNPMVHEQEHKGMAETVIKFVERNDGKVLLLPDSKDAEKYIEDLTTNDPTYYTHHTLLAFALLDGKFTVAYQPRYRLHLPAIAANLIANTLLINSNPDTSGRIEIVNHPYTIINGGKCDRYGFYRISAPLFWLVYMSFVLTIFMSDFLPFIVEERLSGFKHQQIISGLSPVVYWLSTFVSDMIVYFFMTFLTLTLVILFGKNIVVVDSTAFQLYSLILILHGMSGLVSVYLFSFLVDNASFSSGVYIMFNMSFGLIPAFILYFDIISNYTLFLTLVILFSFIPNFCAALSFGFISAVIYDQHLCDLCGDVFCEDAQKTVFKFSDKEDRTGILIYVIYLSLTWIVYAVMIILIESNFVKKSIFACRRNLTIPPSETEDSDVKQEMELVKLLVGTEDTECPLKVDNLVKKYVWGPIAVKGVNFIVQRGDCFGLLGVNGAGKTTTLKMITGEYMPNRGDAIATKYSLNKDRRKYLSCIGYCPQSDPLLDMLNARDTLKVIATIRGIPQKQLPEEIDFWLDVLDITEHARKPTYTYSGGTKRKLSTAMAFIGNPVVVFLDEPTTGVDPVSRRKLWSLVQARQRAGQAVLLTSHSMEECEALCTRLTIMKDGEMRCIGTAEFLKNKFAQGYTVLIKLINPTEAELFRLKQDFQELFPSSHVKDEHYTLLHYHLTDSKILLSDLFSSVLQLKDKYTFIEDFHASNTTLEHLFLAFAQDQEVHSRKSTRKSTYLD